MTTSHEPHSTPQSPERGEATENDAGRPTVAEAIAAWEAKGPTSLTVALMSEALYGVREVCDRVEANPVGWGGAPVVSLVRTLQTRVISPGQDATEEGQR